MIRAMAKWVASKLSEVAIAIAVVACLALGVVKTLDPPVRPLDDRQADRTVLVTSHELQALGGSRTPTWGAIQRYYFLTNDQMKRSMEITLGRDDVDFETVLSQAPEGDVWIAIDRETQPRP